MEEWSMECAEKLAPTLEGIDRVRVAIGLMQARAYECRHLSGKLWSDGNPVVRAIGAKLGDRHEHIEKEAMAFAEKWAGKVVKDPGETKGIVQ